MKYLIPIFLILLFSSCKNDDNGNGVNCTDIFVFGLNVQVRDATTGGIILNNITVTAIDGSYSEELDFIFDSFVGAGERPGDYILEVRAEGYPDFTSNPISVGADECHVITEDVEIELQPN